MANLEWAEKLSRGSVFRPLGWFFAHETGAWNFWWRCTVCQPGTGGTLNPGRHLRARHPRRHPEPR